MGLVSISTLTNGQTNVNAAEFNGLATPILNEFNGNIENINIKSSAAIAISKLALTGAILNTHVNASAAIAGTKISPDFGSQNIVTTGTTDAGSSCEANAYTLGGVATNAAGGLVTTTLMPITSVLSNTSSQNTTSTTGATVDFGATDYVTITDPDTNDEVIVIFTGTFNQSSGSYSSLFAIQDNSTGSYATVSGSLRTCVQYGDGNTYDSFTTIARITGKTSSYNIQAIYYSSGSMTLTVASCSMVVMHIKRRA